MKKLKFQYQEVLVENGSIVDIHDTKVMDRPHIILKTINGVTEVYIAWLVFMDS